MRLTLNEREAIEAARRAEAVAEIVPIQTAYARQHGGRFLLFGSTARGEMQFHREVDLLIDFPDQAFAAAWDFAEDANQEPDLLPYGECKLAFLDHIAPDLWILA